MKLDPKKISYSGKDSSKIVKASQRKFRANAYSSKRFIKYNEHWPEKFLKSTRECPPHRLAMSVGGDRALFLPYKAAAVMPIDHNESVVAYHLINTEILKQSHTIEENEALRSNLFSENSCPHNTNEDHVCLKQEDVQTHYHHLKSGGSSKWKFEDLKRCPPQGQKTYLFNPERFSEIKKLADTGNIIPQQLSLFDPAAVQAFVERIVSLSPDAAPEERPLGVLDTSNIHNYLSTPEKQQAFLGSLKQLHRIAHPKARVLLTEDYEYQDPQTHKEKSDWLYLSIPFEDVVHDKYTTPQDILDGFTEKEADIYKLVQAFFKFDQSIDIETLIDGSPFLQKYTCIDKPAALEKPTP